MHAHVRGKWVGKIRTVGRVSLLIVYDLEFGRKRELIDITDSADRIKRNVRILPFLKIKTILMTDHFMKQSLKLFLLQFPESRQLLFTGKFSHDQKPSTHCYSLENYFSDSRTHS